METNKLSEKQLNEALIEVRKAHRLIYEYQRRMQDLSWFVKNKLGFPDYKGYKGFSAPLKDKNKIDKDNWSWDWIYTYKYRYYLGEMKSGENEWQLNLLQVSDTGYYESIKNGMIEKEEVSEFASAEKADSKLVFYLSPANHNQNLDDWEPGSIMEQYANADEPMVIQNEPNQLIIYPVSISKFLNEESTIIILQDFVNYCNENVKTELRIQK